MTQPTHDHEPLIHPPRHWGLVVAMVATLIAVPLIVLDNRDTGVDPTRTTLTPQSLATVVVPVGRPEIGPPKGISVVTSSTTSSTLPLTTTTTTQPGPGAS